MEKTAVRPCGKGCTYDLDLVDLRIHKLACEFLHRDFIYLKFLTINEMFAQFEQNVILSI